MRVRKPLVLILFLIGCSTSKVSWDPLQTVPYVDINRFMGDWYVIANIPTFIEKRATNAMESYKLNNKGEIETTDGTVALISGEKVKLSLNGNSLIQYSIERGVLNALIDNKQALKVDDGTIILSAKGVKEVKNAVIKNSGSLRADGITKKGGKIYLSASNGKILNSE